MCAVKLLAGSLWLRARLSYILRFAGGNLTFILLYWRKYFLRWRYSFNILLPWPQLQTELNLRLKMFNVRLALGVKTFTCSYNHEPVTAARSRKCPGLIISQCPLNISNWWEKRFTLKLEYPLMVHCYELYHFQTRKERKGRQEEKRGKETA